ncbi:MAG: tetratricopeptide repeat protein [Bacteroidales bacterium]|nr:tetratricopeptide repeat protein [Bacteroidales bacterium]MDD3702161.1 tetratricopeptide repeat protein [Bacteroidales bacterium]MDY0370418.1 tetratricopeptide repeat protein [Bacteroidales bacterium]
MYRILLMALFFLFVAMRSDWQTDTLIVHFEQSNSVDERFDLAIQIATRYLSSDPVKTIEFLQEALRDSSQVTDRVLVGKSLNYMGVAYYYMGEIAHTEFFLLEAIKVIEQTGDEKYLIRILKNLGLAYDRQGKYDQALQIYFQNLNYYLSEHDSNSIAGVMSDIGNVYFKTQNLELAKQYQQKGLEFITQTDQGQLILGNILNSIGVIYSEILLMDSAIYFFEQALEIKKQFNNIFSINNTLNNLCSCIDYKQEPQKSIQCYKELLENQIKVNDMNGIAISKFNLALTYSSLEDYAAAIEFFEELLIIHDEITNLYTLSILYKTYSQVLFHTNQFEKAYKYRRIYETYQDSLAGLGKQQLILDLDQKYANQQKEEQIKRLQIEGQVNSLTIQNQRLLILFTAVFILLLIVTAIFLFYRYRRKQKIKKERELYQQKEAERIRIARDMHDEIGAGLTRMIFRSEQIKSQVSGKPEIEGDIVTTLEKMGKDARQLSQNMGEIIWSLNPHYDSFDILCAYLRNYMYEYLEDTRIQCRLHFPDEIPEQAVKPELRRNIFLIVKEALNNIVKYSEATEVVVELNITENFFSLRLADNGKGVKDETRYKAGNGFRNIRSRIEECGGELVIQNHIGHGLAISLENIPFQFHTKV